MSSIRHRGNFLRHPGVGRGPGWVPAYAGTTSVFLAGTTSVFLAILSGCASTSDRLAPLAAPGDPARGREVFVAREAGHCVICHAAPGITVAGNVGPSLAGVGSRLDAAQIRLRVVDITRAIPEATMPAFHRTEDLRNVAAAYRGKPVLSAAQVEDVVAWLATLR